MSQGRRVTPLPSDWSARRVAVFDRDGDQCHVCGSPGADHIDHVIPASEGGTDDLDNLAPIHSTPCHARKTGREAARARARKYRRHRTAEEHPGLKH